MVSRFAPRLRGGAGWGSCCLRSTEPPYPTRPSFARPPSPKSVRSRGGIVIAEKVGHRLDRSNAAASPGWKRGLLRNPRAGHQRLCDKHHAGRKIRPACNPSSFYQWTSTAIKLAKPPSAILDWLSNSFCRRRHKSHASWTHERSISSIFPMHKTGTQNGLGRSALHV
jgi:hypothetical protein